MLFVPPTATRCFYTTVRNMTGGEKFFGFLPPYGKRLADGEEYTVFGDLRNYFNKTTSAQKRRALEAAVDSGALVVVETPVPLAYDETLDVTKAITVVNGSVVDTDPCFGAYSSSE
jgi:hypothetical protein